MSIMSDNSWVGKKPIRRLGGMSDALSLASDLGFSLPHPPFQEESHNVSTATSEGDDLIKVLRELTTVQRKIADLQVELQGRKEDKNVAHLTHVGEMKKKFETLARITTILKDFIQNKDRIIARLQQPYSLDCIPVEAEYQVIPALGETTDEQSLLSELVNMWEKYSIMSSWLEHILEPLNWFYLDNRGVTIRSIAIGTFYEQIHRDMEGNFMHQELLTKIVQFFIHMKEVDDGKEFEELESLVLYYFKKKFSRLARMWISHKRPVVYLEKVELCLELVETRMILYFSPTTVQKLLEVGRSRLLDKQVFNLIERVFNF